jgi:hypothetical protein
MRVVIEKAVNPQTAILVLTAFSITKQICNTKGNYTMKLGFSQPEIIPTATTLGLPTKGFVQRQGRVAHASDSTLSNQVMEIDDGIFRVRSQYQPHKSYLVNINGGHPNCDCPDGQRTLNCKHRIASLLYLRQEIDALTVTDETHKSCNQRGRWIVTDDQDKVVYHIYRDGEGRLICPCGRKSDCKHRKAIKEYIRRNECRTEFALEIQAKLNRHLNRLKHSGKGSKDPKKRQLRLDNPFEEADSYDIDQIEGRRSGDLAWKLSNGQYIISYQGVMTLADRHSIQFSVSIHDDADLVIATAMNGDKRASGKEVRFCGFDTQATQPKGLTTTASELAKRNAARQLLPLSEIKAIEHKAKLKAEFDWQAAYEKCAQVAGTKANVDITINELVKASKLRQDKKSHYNRTEWLMVYHACKDDNDDGGAKPPSSNNDDSDWKEKLRECKEIALNDGFDTLRYSTRRRFNWIKTDLMKENALRKAYPRYWTDQDFDLLQRACALDTSLFNRKIGEHWVIQKEDNFNHWDYSRRYRFWIISKDTQELRERCFYCGQTKGQVSQLYDDLIYWERYHIKTVICSDCLKTTKEDMTRRFRELYNAGEDAVNTDGLPKLAEQFLVAFQEKLTQVRQGGDAK